MSSEGAPQRHRHRRRERHRPRHRRAPGRRRLQCPRRRPRARRRRPRRAVCCGPDHPRGQPRRRRCGARALRRLDAIVANAGFQHVAPIAEFPEDRWDALLAHPAHEPVPARQVRAGRRWRAAATGASSSSPRCTAWSPRRSRRATSSAKHGVLGLVKTLALEGADRGSRRPRSARASCARRWSRARSPTRREAHGCPRSACSRT